MENGPGHATNVSHRESLETSDRMGIRSDVAKLPFPALVQVNVLAAAIGLRLNKFAAVGSTDPLFAESQRAAVSPDL
ncbi:MAG: hypothetical protein CMJ58_19805 [Planctomycetaceae bacterium]|nr:hypothetical protein [Planctomycetaceae bacterium]